MNPSLSPDKNRTELKQQEKSKRNYMD